MASGNYYRRKTRRTKRIHAKLSAAFIYLVLSISVICPAAAASGSSENPNNSRLHSSRDIFAEPGPVRVKILKSAYSMLGAANGSMLTARDRTFKADCIGTVLAVFYKAGIDIVKYTGKYDGTGVQNVFSYLTDNESIFYSGMPEPGDLIFWDNTWDANGDGNRINDPLTHIGIVLKTDEHGTVYYLHSHIKKGLVVQSMNRYSSGYYSLDGTVINHAMAMNSGISRDNNPDKWTSGQLWSAYGSIKNIIADN